MKRRRTGEVIGPLLMILPALVVFVLFIILPFFSTLRLSFFEWDGITQKSYVGWANYRSLASDLGPGGMFRSALWNNCVYWWITLVSEMGVGLVLAALVVRCRRWKTAFRLALSMPLMIALVASAVLWRQLLHAISGPINWMSPEMLPVTIGLVSGWVYCGFYMLLFSAGLERIPDELREAARVDGASDWHLFWKIELPLLRSVDAVAFLLCTTGAFRAFDLFWIMAGQMRDPASEVAATYVVKMATTAEARGYSAALAVVVVLLVVLGGTVISRLTSRVKELEY